jgi:hypothetical protein
MVKQINQNGSVRNNQSFNMNECTWIVKSDKRGLKTALMRFFRKYTHIKYGTVEHVRKEDVAAVEVTLWAAKEELISVHDKVMEFLGCLGLVDALVWIPSTPSKGNDFPVLKSIPTNRSIIRKQSSGEIDEDSGFISATATTRIATSSYENAQVLIQATKVTADALVPGDLVKALTFIINDERKFKISVSSAECCSKEVLFSKIESYLTGKFEVVLRAFSRSEHGLEEVVDFSTIFVSEAECVIYTTEGFNLLQKAIESFPQKGGASMTLEVGEDAAVLREKRKLLELQNQEKELQNRATELQNHATELQNQRIILSLDIPDTEKAELFKRIY